MPQVIIRMGIKGRTTCVISRQSHIRIMIIVLVIVSFVSCNYLTVTGTVILEMHLYTNFNLGSYYCTSSITHTYATHL